MSENPPLESLSTYNLLAYTKHLANRALPICKPSLTDDPCPATSGPSDDEALDPRPDSAIVETLVST